MRGWLLVAGLGLLMALTVPDAQARNRPRNQDGTRPRSRNEQGRTRTGRTKPLKARLVPGPSIPVEPRGQGQTLFLESYRDLQEEHSSYNIIPGKQGQCLYRGLAMFDQAVWSPTPCMTCLCTGGRVLCDNITCPTLHCHFPSTPAGECCPVCMESEPDLSIELSGDSPAPNEHNKHVTPLTKEEIQQILWREEEGKRKKERLKKKDETRKKRRKQRKEKAERQRKIVEERRREEEEALRMQMEEEWKKQMEEAERKRQEDVRMQKKKEEREERWKERKREEETGQEMLREELLSLVEEEEQEEEVWLRGDVFQMPESETPKLSAIPIPTPPVAKDEEEEEEEEEGEQIVAAHGRGLPPGCNISDVTATCDNAKLIYFPPLDMSELRSLSLEGNNISRIPAEAFNGIPNLEWINLKKNKLTSAGIDANAFRGLKMLRRLYLDGNLLEVVPSDLPPTLQELKISENRLQRIHKNNFQDLSSLMILELEGNLLSEGNVDPMAFTPLVQLSYLRLGRNHFRTVPQGLPMSLLELYLENNLIEEISETVFNQTQSLNVVSLRHNRLDETRIAPLAWIDNRNLESIDLSYNHLHLVPSCLPRSLVHLVLVGNRIERVPGFVFAHMDPGLEYLYLSYNKLDGEGTESESFFGCYSSMVELCLDHNQLITVPSGINEMTNLHFLSLHNNKIRSVHDESICDLNRSGEPTLVTLRLENNYIDPQKLSPTAFSCVQSSSGVILKPQNTK